MFALMIVLQASLLAYHQATTLLDLFPFNNVRSYSLKERLMECSVNGCLMAMPLAGFLGHIAWIKTATLVLYPALLLGEYLGWWQPYLFGATAQWTKTYDRLFRPTIVVLPAVGNNPIPNLEHCILHGLMLITTVCTYIYFFST